MRRLCGVALACLLTGPAMADELGDWISRPYDDGLIRAMNHPVVAPPENPPATMPDLSPSAWYPAPPQPATNQTCVFTPPAMWSCTSW